MFQGFRLCAAVTAIMMAGGIAASAQEGAAFFDGKTVNYIVATAPGAVYDSNGRLVAEYMQKYLPGSTFVVRNMDGAGGVIGANFVYGSTPDGLTIGSFNPGLIYTQLTENPALRLDLTQMSWIGKLASDPRVILVTEESGVASMEDLLARPEPVKFSTCGVGCGAMVESKMLIGALGLPVELVSGYNGNEGHLALRRGEVQGVFGSRSSYEPLVTEGHAHFIAQIGGSQTDVPQLASVTTDPAALRSIELIGSQSNLARLTGGPPGIPADRLQALEEAYRAATSDPEFLERAAAMEIPLDPLVGAEVKDAVLNALDQTPEMIAFLKEVMSTK